MEVLRPIGDAVDDVFAHHIALRSSVVTDTRPIGERSIGISAEIVARHGFFQCMQLR
ncbi:hypothetical protein SDC9_83941 [bioreactor metagenome]|uniref:Uncharacterized protein n=1 Tax=bioreactor metagenome TaxID=1076179 RepID=A0A644ZBR7_9ZZZZ